MSLTDKLSSKGKFERTLKLNFRMNRKRLRKGINTQWRCEWNRQWMSERNLLWSRWRRGLNRKTRKREGIENQGKEPKESLWRRQRQSLRAGKTESLVLLFLESLTDIFSPLTDISLCFTRERIEKGRRMIGPTPTSPQAHSLHVNLDWNEWRKDFALRVTKLELLMQRTSWWYMSLVVGEEEKEEDKQEIFLKTLSTYTVC